MITYIQIYGNQYPIGWDWLHYVPLEDWQWLLDIFATTTDNMTTYEYATYLEDNYTISKIDAQGLAKFMDDDQGYEGGIREYGYYIAAKTLGIKSEQEYMDNFDKIQQLCNK